MERTKIGAAVASAMVLAGCGNVGPGPGVRGGGLRAQEDPAGSLKEALRKAYGELQTMTGRATYQELDPKDGKVHGSVATFKTDVGKRWIRGLVLESDRPNARGAETLFLNDGKITVRVRVGFVPITRTFPIDAEEVTSSRYYRLDQTDFAAMARMVLAEGAALEALGPGELLGRKVDLLDVAPSVLPDVSHERIGLDPATHLPVARQAFAPKTDPPEPGGLWAFRPSADPPEQSVLTAVLDGEVLDPVLPPGTWKF